MGLHGHKHSKFGMRNNSNFNQHNLRRFQGTRRRENNENTFLRKEAYSKKDVAIEKERIDEKMGFHRISEPETKLGWLVNMKPTTIKDSEYPDGRSAVDLYFITETEETFKATFLYKPYFLVLCADDTHIEVQENLLRRFQGTLNSCELIVKEDLSLPNHLSGHQRKALKLSFLNIADLMAVRKFILPIAQNNENKKQANHTYSIHNGQNNKNDLASLDPLKFLQNNIIGVREYDVPYLCRVAIDIDIRVGLWYNVRPSKEGENELSITPRPDLVHRPDPVVFAFDIETTKLPLKFPDASFDSIMMISYMVNGQGYLITNREVISDDINDFEYTPLPGFEGSFTIFNEKDEKSVLLRFFNHIRTFKPTVLVTYNGDFFDLPFVDKRAEFHGLDMFSEIGFKKDEQDEYKSSYCIHMDCLAWVKRDSYLPAGSHGLKAVTTAKLGYHPLELDPEDMMRAAHEEPQVLAQYSVSDAVATYYLYMKYVHPFIFSLCNIIPTMPDEVLRKGSGTLCEYLLMVEAYKTNVIMPNKNVESYGKLFNGHLIESETYVGGHVEALEAGVFRSDLPTQFNILNSGIDTLLDQLDNALKFSLKVEGGIELDNVLNYEEVYENIKSKLLALKGNKPITTTPLIYHLDVAAMYPNIILTNRLQPDAMVDEATCAKCAFNVPGKVCDRKMTWSWRAEYYPATQDDINTIVNQLSSETFPGKSPSEPYRTFNSLNPSEQNDLMKKRVQDYCRKVYNKIRSSKVVERESIVCQRENPFYINTVRNFRDRRYQYKGLHKTWKNRLQVALKENNITLAEEAKKLIIVYDSLQLAHKCILNSFYGYVMRKGSRWYSMEMGGIICLTGAKIIQMARKLIDQIGRPLELDTDGIWCILPSSFPEEFTFQIKDGKKFKISYPCTMLNHLVHDQFTNNQYQDLIDPITNEYSIKSENSIFFEVDGPYRAMILPSSTEADKLLKKRYAVFNHDGSLAELKGFEIKRRGELKLIKIFQSQIFSQFLLGSTLTECYSEVAKVANQWLDILYNKGKDLQDEELFELIAENRSMSKSLSEYGSQKSTAISTAKRLAEFLGDEMVKDKGLACKFIVSKLPPNVPVSERAIPTTIFSADHFVKLHYLKKWTKDPSLDQADLRDILDWDYYIERFGFVIQKLITIPAAMQKVENPVPRVRHPDWLAKRLKDHSSRFSQMKISDLFEKVKKTDLKEIEDFGIVNGSDGNQIQRLTARVTVKRRKEPTLEETLNQVNTLVKPLESGTIYSGWISTQRKKWKLNREINEKNKEEDLKLTFNQRHFSKPKISGFHKMNMPYLCNPFQILHIIYSDTPGILKIWLLTGTQMYCIKVKVPRTFYINSKAKSPELLEGLASDLPMKIQKSSLHLPRSLHRFNLHKVEMDEEFYSKNFTEFLVLRSHSSVEGVYESNLDPLDNALINLGCICSFVGNIGPTIPNIFELDSIARESVSMGTYLDENISLNHLILLHESEGTRHMIALISPQTKEGILLVIDSTRKPTSQLPNLQTLYQNYYDHHSSNPNFKSLLQLPDSMKVLPTFYQDLKEALAHLNKYLFHYQTKKHGPTMVLIYSQQANFITKECKTLSEFPMLNIPYDSARFEMPLLGWQGTTIAKIFSLLFSLPNWLEEMIRWSNFSNLPLGNLPSFDLPLKIIDITFARFLKENQQVLWWTDKQLPDLGGHEDDHFRFLVDEELRLPSWNKPTSSSSICLELSIDYLMVNTILNYHMINELEASSGLFENGSRKGFFIKSNEDETNDLNDKNQDKIEEMEFLDSNTINERVFECLRIMLKEWIYKLIENQCVFSEQMIKHMFRWLVSSRSKLYDNELHNLMKNLISKLFYQLVACISNTGAEILHASYQKLIISTNKYTSDNAIGFGNYIINTVLSKPLFRNLAIQIEFGWKRLIWIDSLNYGGVILEEFKNKNHNQGLSNNKDLIKEWEQTQQMARVGITYDKSLNDNLYWLKEIEMTWSISSYLPPLVKMYFDIIIGKYIWDTYWLRKQQSQSQLTDSQISEKEIELTKKLINEELNSRLTDIIPDINHTIEALVSETPQLPGLMFPNLPGSHYYKNDKDGQGFNPVLEWLKSLFGVFELDERYTDEIHALRYNLLNCINVNPCSEIAQSYLPSNSNDQSINNSFPIQSDSQLNEHQVNIIRSSNQEKKLTLPTALCRTCNFGFSMDFLEHLIRKRNSKLQGSSSDENTDNDEIREDTSFIVGNILESSPEPINNYDNSVLEEPTSQLNYNNINQNFDEIDLIDLQSEPFYGLHCPSCTSLFPVAQVEQILLDYIDSLLAAYQQQDLMCPKCRLPPISDLDVNCRKCTLELMEVQYPRDKLIEFCKSLKRIANNFKLERLDSQLTFILEF